MTDISVEDGTPEEPRGRGRRFEEPGSRGRRSEEPDPHKFEEPWRDCSFDDPERDGRPTSRDAMDEAPVLLARGLSKTYRLGKVTVSALDGVSVAIARGSMVCVMGRSGSGKSTLLRQLGLIDVPDAGSIEIDGEQVGRLPERRRCELRLRKLGYVFQEYALLEELTAEENVCLPAIMLGESRRECRRRALAALELVGLGERARHRPKELSGGEQQRAAIARALINGPRILYADEPTANLDTASASVVMRTLEDLNRELAVTIVFVSHEPDDRAYATAMLLMRDGALVEGTR